MWSFCSKPYNDIQQPAKIWTDSSNQKGFSRRIHQPSPSFSRHHRKTSNFVMHEPTWRLVVPWNFEAFKNRRTLISRVKKNPFDDLLKTSWLSFGKKHTFFNTLYPKSHGPTSRAEPLSLQNSLKHLEKCRARKSCEVAGTHSKWHTHVAWCIYL